MRVKHLGIKDVGRNTISLIKNHPIDKSRFYSHSSLTQGFHP